MSPRGSRASAMLVLVITASLTGCSFDESSPAKALREFLTGWQLGDYAAAAERTNAGPKSVVSTLEQVRLQLDAAAFQFGLGPVERRGLTAQAKFRAQVDLGENGQPWKYDGQATLDLVDGRWKVRWSPSIVHPRLGPGQRLAVINQITPREPVLDAQGNPLTSLTVVHEAGVVPARLRDPKAVAEALAATTGLAADRLEGLIYSAPPAERVPLAMFGNRRYEEVRGRLAGIPGLEITTTRLPLSPAPPREIVGRVDAVTAESAQEVGGLAQAGDTVGLSGLQLAYQRQLASRMSTRVVTLDAQGREVEELMGQRVIPGNPVHTTIDSKVQQAAERAVGGSGAVALVAVDPRTGNILAVGADGGMRQDKHALDGEYPAGGAFSLVVAEALLSGGFDPKTRIPCPASRTVGGDTFRNPGTVGVDAPPFRDNFRKGCVTAFAALARLIPDTSLRDALSRFGIGAHWRLPLPSFSGAYTPWQTDGAKARVVTGEAVRMSPLGMALVTGAVASGGVRQPRLVLEPESASAPEPAVTLNAGAIRTMRAMMRDAVRSSDPASAAAASGGDVHGITFPARHVVGGKTRSLSWFVGWQGNVAIAVLAETADQSAVAGVAGRFFEGLHPAP